MGHVVDSTETMLLRRAAKTESRRAQLLVEHCADLIFTVNADGRLADANPAAGAIIEWREDDSAIEVFAAIVHRDDAVGVLEAQLDAARHPGRSNPITFRIKGAGGSWTHDVSAPLPRSEAGQLPGTG
jgi:PAS domain-containing protein